MSLTGYAVNFNRRHKRYGHLFQNRYKSILCEDDPYLLELTRYIHPNPLRGGLLAGSPRFSRQGGRRLKRSMTREYLEAAISFKRRLKGRKKKRKTVTRSRKLFCQIAVRKLGYSGAEVARHLGVTTSAVNRLAIMEELSDLDRFF